eukprot:jgi/Ulvmu1/7594/UM038_0017.1
MAGKILSQAVYLDVSNDIVYRFVKFTTLEAWLQMELDQQAHTSPVELVSAWNANRLPPCLRPKWDLPTRAVVCLGNICVAGNSMMRAAYQVGIRCFTQSLWHMRALQTSDISVYCA